MSYIVYKLSDPRTNTVHYVGVTKSVFRRYAQHLLFPFTNEVKGDWLQGLERDGLMPVLEILERDLPQNIARERERFWIKYYQSQNEPLTNAVVRHSRRRTRPEPDEQEDAVWVGALRKALKARGWSLLRRERDGLSYIYAARKVGGKREERYIGPLKSLKTLNGQSLSDKLTNGH